MKKPIHRTTAMIGLVALGLGGSALMTQAHTFLTAHLNAPVPGTSCNLFPSNNVWNADISALPTATNSGSLINAMSPTANFHPDFGSNPTYGIPYNVVNGSVPKVSVKFLYANESDPGPYPIPANPKIESGSDRHMLLVDSSTCTLYELYNAQLKSDGWHAGSGAIWNLRSNALRPAGWTSADAAGLPILPGLVRYDEVYGSKAINHALRFTTLPTRNTYIYPARHQAGTNNTALPPMGLRLRLKASVNISGYPADDQVLLKALQHYGMILADNGSPWYVTGETNTAWNDTNLNLLKRLTGNSFEVVDTSHLVNGPDASATPTATGIRPTATIKPATATPTATSKPATATSSPKPATNTVTVTRTTLPATATTKPATATATQTPAPPTATFTPKPATPTTSAPTSTPTPGSTGSGPSIAGCPIFPTSDVWNQDISALPTATNSQTMINTIGLNTGLHPDFGSDPTNGIPYQVTSGVPATTSVTFDYADESDVGPYPIPPNPLIEAGSDQHMLMMNKDNCHLYELFAAQQQPDGSWQAGSGAIWDLHSNALRPDGWTSADAAGLPILPGLVRYDEVFGGGINHALRFTVPSTRRTHLYPARHDAGPGGNDPSLPPMGLRVRLKANVDISSFPVEDRVILTALKKYGMILADNGSPWFISGAPDTRWSDDNLHKLNQIIGNNLEVVDTSNLVNGS